VLGTGCQWSCLPKDFPPKRTLYRYFCDWAWGGALDHIYDGLCVKCRERAEREDSPTAATIDSQSVKSGEKGGAHRSARGYDAGKTIKGKKRHVLVDAQGLLMGGIVHCADIQARNTGFSLQPSKA